MTVTRSLLAVAAAAVCSLLASGTVSAALITQADFSSTIDEWADDSLLSDSSTQRVLSRSNVSITGATELTDTNADSDVDGIVGTPSFVNVDMDPATNGITVTVTDEDSRPPPIEVDFIEVVIDNIVFGTPATLISINLVDDSLPSDTSPDFDLVAEIVNGSIVIRWEETNVDNFFQVNPSGQATFTLTTSGANGANDIPEPGTLALLGAALVCMGAIARRRVGRG